MKDHIDQAIDTVAARMTAVEEDRDLALRIANALPQRSMSIGWVARFAWGSLATVAIIIVALRSFSGGSTKALRTENAVPVLAAPIVEPQPNPRRTGVNPAVVVRRTIAEPSLDDRRTNRDHEFSLPALAELAPLEDEALDLAPLEIADLPLTSDFPR